MKAMNADEALMQLLQRCLPPARVRRYATLGPTTKGRRKILASLHHDLHALRLEAVHSGTYGALWDQPCYVFASGLEFGTLFSSVTEAYDRLALRDDWLIVLADASHGIYRPEGRWDNEKLLG
jgi:hypothetical protein